MRSIWPCGPSPRPDRPVDFCFPSKAQASQEADTLHASFELQAGGYNGSTNALSYDPATDRLVGTYFQAVAKQKFDVYFVRQKIEGAPR